MGNARTLHRRNARKRAHEREREYQRRRARMTQAQRDADDAMLEMQFGLVADFVERQLAITRLISHTYDGAFGHVGKVGDTINVNLRAPRT